MVHQPYRASRGANKLALRRHGMNAATVEPPTMDRVITAATNLDLVVVSRRHSLVGNPTHRGRRCTNCIDVGRC